MSKITFRITTIAEALSRGITDMAEDNFAEVEHFRDRFPFQPNWRAFQRDERLGDFFGIGAFRGDDMVGYAGYIVGASDHHKNDLWAINKVLYMAPPHRGWDSIALMHAGEEEARRRGAKVILQAVKEPNSTDGERSAKLEVLLQRQGYQPFERILAKVL